ncbi:hypothetical protein [Salinisphaera hydrothermalis]|uniref:Tat pathway signal sequence domain protein n=1 Tax=Salinisphaera hydrothermalis (strain C41B8) TaxID=1304275 RepID=A0A084INT3_SALHC|nr:hypothetical protein [Salinisphaera hydrothermalis]KEZ78367.1 Tat pathway signal sequence domain protein [Salinisphaera hydrothermalis C41B8]
MQRFRILLCIGALSFAGMAWAQTDNGQATADGASTAQASNAAASTAGDASESAASGTAPGNTSSAPSSKSATASSQAVDVELNKLTSVPNACRAYLVTQNLTDRAFDSFKLDVVMFDNNGIVAKRLAVQLGPMPAGKTSLKVFDIPGLACKQIGQLLLNDVLQCTVNTGNGPPKERHDCLSLISVSQRGRVPFIE